MIAYVRTWLLRRRVQKQLHRRQVEEQLRRISVYSVLDNRNPCGRAGRCVMSPRCEQYAHICRDFEGSRAGVASPRHGSRY